MNKLSPMIDASRAKLSILTAAARRYARPLAWNVLYLWAAVLIGFYAYLHFGGDVGRTLYYYPAASFDRMVDGTAEKPYVGRMLVPLVLRAVDNSSPRPFRSRIVRLFKSPALFMDFQGASLEYRECVFMILAVLMFYGIALGGRAAFCALYPLGRGIRLMQGDAMLAPEHEIKPSPMIAGLAGLIYLLAIPLWFRYIAYIYDPATILLATWMVYAAARSRLWLCIGLFILACINKETTPLFLPVILCGLYPRHGWQRTLEAGLVMISAAALTQVYRTSQFATNAGAWTESHWRNHQLILAHFLPSVIYAGIVLIGSLCLAMTRISKKPAILGLGLATVLLPLFAASIPFGFVDEIRALMDAYPFVMLLAIPTILSLLEVPSVSVIRSATGVVRSA